MIKREPKKGARQPHSLSEDCDIHAERSDHFPGKSKSGSLRKRMTRRKAGKNNVQRPLCREKRSYNEEILLTLEEDQNKFFQAGSNEIVLRSWQNREA